MTSKTYSSDEVKAILQVALEQQANDGLSHNELVAAAAELGIDSQHVDGAITALARQTPIQHEIARVQRRRSLGLKNHALTYTLVMLAMLGLNLWVGGPLWVLFPALGWGLGLALHTKSVVLSDPERDRERAERAIDRQERKALRAAKKAERKEILEGFKESLEDGAFTALETVSRKIREELDASGRRRR